MNPRRPFLYGFALGIMLATISSYYHFCRPLQQQSVSDLTLRSEAGSTLGTR
ncbi:hypothetical protein D3C83_250160 [compost metagenome]